MEILIEHAEYNFVGFKFDGPDTKKAYVKAHGKRIADIKFTDKSVYEFDIDGECIGYIAISADANDFNLYRVELTDRKEKVFKLA